MNEAQRVNSVTLLCEVWHCYSERLHWREYPRPSNVLFCLLVLNVLFLSSFLITCPKHYLCPPEVTWNLP